MSSLSRILFIAVALLPLFSALPAVGSTSVCPFCSAVNLTLTEQIRAKDITVFAELVKLPELVEDPDTENLPKATFRVVTVVKGDKYVEQGMDFQALMVGSYSVGQRFMVQGINPPVVKWTSTLKATPELEDYVARLKTLPESGVERLTYIQQFFEHEQSILAFDAYDEFAGASYKDMLDLEPEMNREKLLAWISDTDTQINRRCLYLTMLGICGTVEDGQLLEEFILSDDRRKRAGLDALAACYLKLVGERGVDILEEKYLADSDAEYGETSAIISALRFIETETNSVPRERIAAALRNVLDRPKIADTVIPDLARMEDWSVVDKLVDLFKNANDDQNWIRTPVITYLRACPLPEAKAHIEELRKIDPDAVRRSDFYIELGSDSFEDYDEVDDLEDLPEEDPAASDEPSDASPAEPIDQSGENQGGGESTPELQENGSGSGTVAMLPDPSQMIGATFTSTPAVDVPASDENVKTGSFDSNSLDAGSVEYAGGAQSGSAATAPVDDDVVADSSGVAAVANSSVDVSQSAPVAAIEPRGLMLKVVFIPMAVCMLIFVLLWSVLHGWFERLIF